MASRNGLLVALLFATACKHDGKICDPGETQHCACPGGTFGVQECSSSGEQWSDCDCSSTDGSTDTLTDTASDTHGDGGEVVVECTTSADCDDSDPCTMDNCDDAGDCEYLPTDADDDGFPAAQVGGSDCGGSDCDDSDDSIHPAAIDDDCYDGVDRACDGVNGPQPLIDAVVLASAGMGAPAMAWTGSELGLVWSGSSAGVMFSRVSIDGTRIGSDVPFGSSSSTGGRLVYNGDRFGISYMDLVPPHSSMTVHLAVLESDGTVVVSDSAMGVETGTLPHLTWTGSRFALLAYEAIDVARTGINFAAFDGSGGLADGPALALDTGSAMNVTGVLWTGSELVGSWMFSLPGTIAMQRLTDSGVPVGSAFEVTSATGIGSYPMVWGGSSIGVLWAGAGAAFFQILDPGLAPVSSAIEMTLENEAMYPSVLWTGSSYSLLWNEMDPSRGFMTAMYAPEGTAMQAPGVLRADEADVSGLNQVWMGSELVVAWGNGAGTAQNYQRFGWCD